MIAAIWVTDGLVAFDAIVRYLRFRARSDLCSQYHRRGRQIFERAAERTIPYTELTNEMIGATS